MKKFLTSVLILLTFSLALLSGCNYTVKTPSVKIELDNTVGFMQGEEYSELQSNADRGFRLEYAITIGADKAYPNSEKRAIDYVKEQQEYYKLCPTKTAQLTVFLKEFSNLDVITEAAFEELYNLLIYIRKIEQTLIIRFAYSDNSADVPSQERLLKHISQVGVWLTDNARLVNDVVIAFQVGFVGANGTWDILPKSLNKKQVLKAIYDIVPKGMYIQGNSVDLKNDVVASNYNYNGFYDQHLTGAPTDNNVGGAKINSKQYYDMVTQSQFLLNDGELPKPANYTQNLGYIDGLEIIKRASERNLSTLSIANNFIENGQSYNIDRWKTEFITMQDLDKIGVNYNPNWFKDRQGNFIKRTVFEFLRDHLGYQLVASNYKQTDSVKDGKKTTTIQIMLTNFGMACPLTFDEIHIYAKYKPTGAITKLSVKEAFGAKDLSACGQAVFTAEIATDKTELTKDFMIGISIKKDNNTAKDCYIRLANNGLYLLEKSDSAYVNYFYNV
ncbi:MAG: DUF4874 domain-containing protein [Clostridia bacterium]